MLFDDGNGLVARHHTVADVARGVIGGRRVAELRIFQPTVHEVRAAVDLVEVFGVVGAVPLVR